MPRRRGLLGTAARTAVIAGTATGVSRRVAQRHEQKQARLEAKSAKRANAEPSSSHAMGSDLVDSLQRLAELKASGALNAQEYSAAKAKLLSH